MLNYPTTLPSLSQAQQRLMAAALHGANFPKAKKLRGSMSLKQLREFAMTSRKGLPKHAHAR